MGTNIIHGSRNQDVIRTYHTGNISGEYINQPANQNGYSSKKQELGSYSVIRLLPIQTSEVYTDQGLAPYSYHDRQSRHQTIAR